MILPIVKPSIITYLHHAHPLGIAETDPRAKMYLLNNFFQLSTRRNKDGTRIDIDFLAANGYYPQCNFVSRVHETEASLGVLGGTPLDQVCAILESGGYVEAVLDEYFLSGKSAFSRHAFWHQNLIYGYSRPERVLLAQGFNAAREYVCHRIGFDEFQRAFGRQGGVRTLRLTGAVGEQYCAGFIQACLSDFVKSRNTIAASADAGAGAVSPGRWRTALRRVTGRAAEGSVYGMATYGVALRQLTLKNRRHIDMRPWCLFYEHKLRLLALAQYLDAEKSAGLDGAVLAELHQLIGDFRALRGYVLEAQLTDSAVDVAALKKTIAVLASAEKPVIAALINAIA